MKNNSNNNSSEKNQEINNKNEIDLNKKKNINY